MGLRLLLATLIGLSTAPAVVWGQAVPRAAVHTTVQTTDTSANSLLVGCAVGSTTCTGGIKAGTISVNGVGIVGSDGRIPAISTTYFASLSGANLTGITEASITDSTILARVAANETITGAWTFSGSSTLITDNSPALRFDESDASANNGTWRFLVNSEQLIFAVLNDAENAAGAILTVDRTGTTVDSLAIGAAQTRFTDGSSSAPSISFNSDTDTGLYWWTTAGPVTGFSAVVGAVPIASFYSGASGAAGSYAVPLAISADSNQPLSLNRLTNDGTIVDIQQGSVSEGTIAVSGTTVSYNTFLATHYTQLLPEQVEPEYGTVVASTGLVIPNRQTRRVTTPDAERFVYVRPTTRRNQPSVYGVWHAPLGRTAAGMSWGDPSQPVHQVASIGQTLAQVTDTCGDLHTGDLIASSPVEGLAERQCDAAGHRYDPIQQAWTLGKVLVDVRWGDVPPSPDGVRRKLVPVTLYP